MSGVLPLHRARTADVAERTNFHVSIKPLTAHDGTVNGLAVTEQIVLPDARAPLTLMLPLALPAVPRNADAVTALQVSDARGDVALAINDAGPSGDFALRRWTTQRAVGPQVTVRYRAALQPAQTGRPPFSMKAAGLGVAGNSKSFVLLPEALDSAASTLTWDLSDLAPGAIGVATGGAGTLRIPGPPTVMDDLWLLAGPALAGQTQATAGFNAYTIGQPPFDAAATMDWARRAYAVLTDAFGYMDAPRYELLIRALPGTSHETGTARLAGGGSLIAVGSVFSPMQNVQSVQSTIFHEMGHQWVGQLSNAVEPWYAEGMNVFVEATVPCATGLHPPAACMKTINDRAQSYYASPARNWSLQRIDAAGFEQERIRRIPYARGMLYFASVDAALRALQASASSAATSKRCCAANWATPRSPASARWSSTARS
ncbi:hypothetical protein [Xanthomonas citri]|uniref:hypothetical protein n=1 Tax=Xanthomonas citri TaxID=346 RepID=UPI001CC15CC1|nr:hypothetical protein [Xanthomonas citri]